MEYTGCELCKQGGTFSHAVEIAKIPCCVRHFAGEQFTVWRCTECGSLHAKEQVDLPKYYSEYPFKNHKLDYHTKVAYRNRLKMLLKRGATVRSRILDYGCGAGLFIDFLKSHGFQHVAGYDAFIPAFSDPKILEERYDVVTSYDVIEHIDNPRIYLENLLKPLKSDGLLILGTPNADFISLTANPFYQVELSQPYHRHIFSEKALLELCRSYGLVPEHIYRRFYFDSLFPAVNTKFMWEYVNHNGGMLDVCVEPLRWRQVLKSPRLLFLALFGYFLPEHGNILISFRNQRSTRSNEEITGKSVVQSSSKAA